MDKNNNVFGYYGREDGYWKTTPEGVAWRIEQTATASPQNGTFWPTNPSERQKEESQDDYLKRKADEYKKAVEADMARKIEPKEVSEARTKKELATMGFEPYNYNAISKQMDVLQQMMNGGATE